jgi:protease secretion system membrane fusion protein
MNHSAQASAPAEGWLAKVDAFLGGWISGWNPYDPDKLKERTLAPVAVEESNIRKRATQIFLLFFGLFLGWATMAPLDAGVSVQGSVVVMGNRKAVQHPSGGVVQEILVKEGDEVSAGQVLLRINPLKSDAEMTSVELQYINLLASESRLKSERDGLSAIVWPEELNKRFGRQDSRVSEAKKLQEQLFNSRKADFTAQVSSFNEQIAGLSGVLKLRQEQAKTLEQERSSSLQLANDGFVPQNQANQAARAKIEVDSGIVNTQAEISRARVQISQVRTQFLKDVDTQLQEIQKTRDAVSGRMESVKFDQEAAVVRAPASGTVVQLKVFTASGVITGGQVLMEIVPKNQSLAVDVHIPPTLIDKVNVGMLADMRFVAFNQTTTPVIPGRVAVVGADKQAGTTPNEPEFYLGQIQTTSEGRKLLGDLKVQPGMPVDVVIKSGERSFMSYVLKPLSDKFARAMKD